MIVTFQIRHGCFPEYLWSLIPENMSTWLYPQPLQKLEKLILCCSKNLIFWDNLSLSSINSSYQFLQYTITCYTTPYSTSPPGGYQVDGLPPVCHLATICSDALVWTQSIYNIGPLRGLVVEILAVTFQTNPQTIPNIIDLWILRIWASDYARNPPRSWRSWFCVAMKISVFEITCVYRV